MLKFNGAMLLHLNNIPASTLPYKLHAIFIHTNLLKLPSVIDVNNNMQRPYPPPPRPVTSTQHAKDTIFYLTIY